MVINNIKINYQLSMMFIKVNSQHQSSTWRGSFNEHQSNVEFDHQYDMELL